MSIDNTDNDTDSDSENDNANDVIISTIPHHSSDRQLKYCAGWNAPMPRKNVGILSLSQRMVNIYQITTAF